MSSKRVAREADNQISMDGPLDAAPTTLDRGLDRKRRASPYMVARSTTAGLCDLGIFFFAASLLLSQLRVEEGLGR